MLSSKTVATTAELISLTAFSEAYLGRLEREGIIARSERNTWPLIATIAAIVKHLRTERRSRRSEAADRLAATRAQQLALRIERERGKLCPVDESMAVIAEAVGGVVALLVTLPAQHHPHDLAARKALEARVNDLRTAVADKLDAAHERLEREAEKSARRR